MYFDPRPMTIRYARSNPLHSNNQQNKENINNIHTTASLPFPSAQSRYNSSLDSHSTAAANVNTQPRGNGVGNRENGVRR